MQSIQRAFCVAGITCAMLVMAACTTMPTGAPAQPQVAAPATEGDAVEATEESTEEGTEGAEATVVPAEEAAAVATEAATEEPAEEATEGATEGSQEEATPPADEEGAAAPAGDDEAAARLQVPEGFTLNTYFSGLDEPRLMTIGPEGDLYVAERNADAVIRLPDADGDGVADERQVIAENLDQPHNLEWHEGSLYVAATGIVLRLTDGNGDGDMLDEGEIETVTDNIPATGVHSSRTLHFGPDGMLYVAAGSTGNIDIESDRRRATIMRFNPDGTIPEDNPFVDDPDETRHPVWAEGLRNSVDFLFLPDGTLWANHNGSDMLGDDMPPEEIVIAVEGGQHYGWPYCYTPTLGVVPPDEMEVHDERVPFDDRLSSCEEVVPALFTDLAHQAPLGMAQYNADAFPAEHQGNLFVAYHGSWNSTEPRDCKVQEIVVEEGLPVASEPFVTGFRDSEDQDCGGAWGRPAAVAVGPNGELFISDDQNGNIYRVVYTGGQ
jgi:glucose/arabinose dehydrogenase